MIIHGYRNLILIISEFAMENNNVFIRISTKLKLLLFLAHSTNHHETSDKSDLLAFLLQTFMLHLRAL